MKSKLYFGLIVFLTFVIAATHPNEFPRFLFVFEILLAVALFISVNWIEKNLDVTMKPVRISVKQLEEMKLEIRLKNKSRLPIPEIKVCLAYEDLLAGTKGIIKGSAMLESSGEAVLCFRLDSAHCGAAGFWLEEVRISDYLGIFQKKCEYRKGIHEVTVLPESNLVLNDIDISVVGQGGFNQGISLAIRGDDPTEIYDIQNFQQGDSMHSVHWKMSAKMDELMVRILGETLEMLPVIFLDLKHKKESVSRETWDRFLAIVSSFSTRTLRSGITHYVVWWDQEHLEVKRFIIDSDEKLEEMLIVLVRAKLYQSGEIEAFYKETYGNEVQGETIQIDVNGNFIRK